VIKPDRVGPPGDRFHARSGNQTPREDFYRSRAISAGPSGVATLIYDRRGKANQTGRGRESEFAVLADDASGRRACA